jgi:hypothetical protein
MTKLGLLAVVGLPLEALVLTVQGRSGERC